jgi:hypothetical protein
LAANLCGGNRNDITQLERAIAWDHGVKRLRIRRERRDDIHEAFLNLATRIITFRHVQRLC